MPLPLHCLIVRPRQAPDPRSRGLLRALELVSDKVTKSAGGYLDEIGPRLTAAFLDRGLLLRPLGNVVYVMPPYAITETETRWMAAHVHDVLSAETSRILAT